MENDKRLQTIARTFFSYVLTDSKVRKELEELRKIDDPGALVRYVNGLVQYTEPLQQSELPAFQELLSTISTDTGAGIGHVFDIEVRRMIGVKHHKPPEP